MEKIFIVLNEDYFLLTHRKELAVRAQEAGYDMAIVAKNTGRREQVEALGLKMLELPIHPTGKNPIKELKTFWFLYRLYKAGETGYRAPCRFEGHPLGWTGR